MATDTLTTLLMPTASPTSKSPSEEKVTSRIRDLYLRARDAKRVRYDIWMRNYRLVNNRFGNSQSSNSWMPAPRDSEIYPALSSAVAWMTDQEIDIDIIPAADPNSQQFNFINHIADDLNDVLYTTWEVEDYESQIKLALWDTFLYGVGITKAIWDNKAAGGYGNALLRRVDPWAFYPDPNATSLDDMDYCLEVRRMSLDEIQRRFPDTYRKVIDDPSGPIDTTDEKPNLYTDVSRQPKANPGTIPQSGTYPGSSPAFGRWSGGSTSSKKMFEPLPGYVVYECWLRQNKRVTVNDHGIPDDEHGTETRYDDNWRLVVMCNGAILLDCDADELWSHGSHPYERVVFDDIGEFYGISLVDHIAYPQIYVNRLLTALQHNAELTGNPIFMEPAAAGLSRVGIINRPGQRLTLNSPSGMQNAPQWLTPPAMPQQVMDIVQFWISRIENTVGLSALQKGVTPTQRNAEGALNMVQEAAFVRIRSALANLQASLQRSAGKLCDLIIDNYTDPRYMAILSQDGAISAKYLSGHHFHVQGPDGSVPLRYVMRIEAGANGPTSRSARTTESDKLFALGVVDDEFVLNKHRIRNADRVIKRLYEKRQKGLIGTPGQRQRAGRSS